MGREALAWLLFLFFLGFLYSPEHYAEKMGGLARVFSNAMNAEASKP